MEGANYNKLTPVGRKIAIKLSSNHPSPGTDTSVPGLPCANNKTPRSSCEAYCATNNACKGFWYYTNGRCCPKASWKNGKFNRKIQGGDGFYSYLSGESVAGDLHWLPKESRPKGSAKDIDEMRKKCAELLPIGAPALVRLKGGLCLNSPERFKNGGKVDLVTCNERDPNQQWTYMA